MVRQRLHLTSASIQLSYRMQALALKSNWMNKWPRGNQKVGILHFMLANLLR